MNSLALAIDLLAELDALRPITADQEQRIWQKFRFDWNYHSNNIEGNSLTFGETKSLLLHNITAQGKSLKDHIEITGHNEAIDALMAFTRRNEPLSESFVRQLHVLILRERYQVDAVTSEGAPTRRWVEVGQYKAGPNHVQTVTGEIFRFAEPIDVPERMRRLIKSINELQSPTSAEALLCAANAHYEFVRIHPFDDGNGRMARLLMNLILIKYGFPPAIIKTQNKQEYFAALQQADGGQLEPFAEYIARCVCASLQIMLAGARGENIEEPDEQDRQIKMLEKLLEEKAGKLSVVRTVESMNQLFSESFAPLARVLNGAARKFATLYVELKTDVQRNGNSTGIENIELSMEYSRTHIDEVTSAFVFTAQFSNLKFQNVDQFSYGWHVNCTLNPASYEITTNPVTASLRKTYDQRITESEIQELKQHFVSQHINAIEQTTGISLSNF
jgi:Fic family protein